MRFKKITMILLVLILFIILLGGCKNKIFKQSDYSISGKVVDYYNNGIKDVKLHFNNGFGVAITDDEGNWNKSGLKGEVTITPILEGWEFGSKKISAENDNIIFSGIPSDSWSVSFNGVEQIYFNRKEMNFSIMSHLDTDSYVDLELFYPGGDFASSFTGMFFQSEEEGNFSFAVDIPEGRLDIPTGNYRLKLNIYLSKIDYDNEKNTIIWEDVYYYEANESEEFIPSTSPALTIESIELEQIYAYRKDLSIMINIHGEGSLFIDARCINPDGNLESEFEGSVIKSDKHGFAFPINIKENQDDISHGTYIIQFILYKSQSKYNQQESFDAIEQQWNYP